MSFCAWLVSLHTVSSSSIHVTANGRNFIMENVTVLLHTCSLSIDGSLADSTSGASVTGLGVYTREQML